MEKTSLSFLCCIGLAFLISNLEGLPRNRPYMVNRWYLMTGYSETPYSECGGSADLKKVEVIPCDSSNDESCDLKTGSNTTFKISFIPKKDITSLKAVVHGIVAGVPMPFHFPQANACQNSNLTCPLLSGKEYFYSVELPVLKTYPKIKVTVKWQLSDNNGDVVCVKIPSRLT